MVGGAGEAGYVEELLVAEVEQFAWLLLIGCDSCWRLGRDYLVSGIV